MERDGLPKTFYPFTRLSKDIRLIIYELCLEWNSGINMDRIIASLRLEPSRNESQRFLALSLVFHNRNQALLGSRTFYCIMANSIFEYLTTPSILFINRQTRDEASGILLQRIYRADLSSLRFYDIVTPPITHNRLKTLDEFLYMLPSYMVVPSTHSMMSRLSLLWVKIPNKIIAQWETTLWAYTLLAILKSVGNKSVAVNFLYDSFVYKPTRHFNHVQELVSVLKFAFLRSRY